MANLQVVALISGGKDSLYSILHCLANGYDVVALANLHPLTTEDQAVDDLDSYMYQTVGHTVVPLYEQALGLPLFRQDIRGTAVNQEKSYKPTTNGSTHEEDETESLLLLLKTVLRAHPEVNAVSSGAILSDYQRTRVESVALRLGLTSLSYLWQYPRIGSCKPSALLEDMASVGQDARIIKVASGGLDDSFLWRNVCEPQTISRLIKASQRFGTVGDGAVLGEGGEYETLAIDGPAPLWKARIMIDDNERRTIAGEAGSAHVRISGAQVEAKPATQIPYSVPTPALLEPALQRMLDHLAQAGEPITYQVEGSSDIHQRGIQNDAVYTKAWLDGPLFLSNITGHGSNAEEQMSSIMEQIGHRLQEVGHTLSDIAYTSIILRNMDDFPTVNLAYGKVFENPNPPARMTLACADILSSSNDLVTVAVTSVKNQSDWPRRGLHVQSVSYWAPANIGPYSQAISVPLTFSDAAIQSSIVFIAGQIPLIPASMELHAHRDVPPIVQFLHQAVLSLQHLYRIGNTMSVKTWLCATAFIVAPNDTVAAQWAAIARQIWAKAFQDNAHQLPDDAEHAEDWDVWDQQYGANRFNSQWQDHVDTSPENILHSSPRPALTVVRVDGLPKGASIEWVAFGSTHSDLLKLDILHWRHIHDAFTHRAL